MKTLNNDWDTVEFETVTLEDARKALRTPKQRIEGVDPYNSSTRLRKVDENDVDAWFLNHDR